MSILSVDLISPIGSGTTITLNATEVKTGTEITVGTGASIFSPAGNTLTFGTNNVERIRIKNDGKVGIATETGSGLINTRHAGTNQQVLHVRADLGSSNGRSLNLYTPDTDNTTAPFRFQTGNGYLFQCDNEDVFTISHDRKIGIGTDAPSAKLEVQDRSGGTLCGLSVGTQYGNAHFGGYNNYPAIMNSGNQPLIYCDTNNDRTIFFGDTVGFGTTCAFRVNGAERMRISKDGHITKPTTAIFSARGQGSSWNTFNSGSGWYNLGTSSYSGSNYYINFGWTTSGGACGVRGVTSAGNSIWDNAAARFTAPVAGFYFFEISMYIRTNGGGKTFHVQPWIDSANLNYYTSNIGNMRNSSDSTTGDTQHYPNSVMRSIVLYMAANQQFRWSVYSEGTANFQTYFDYAHQSGYLIG